MSPVEKDGAAPAVESGEDKVSSSRRLPRGPPPPTRPLSPMEVVLNGTPVDPEGQYLVVAWDLDTTGRRLLDEICQIGAFHPAATETGVDEEGKPTGPGFSQYVMPYKNPNPGARRSFQLKVVNIGRYRMLKDMDTGKILKTKTEVSALKDLIGWLAEARDEAFGQDKKASVLLVCHEPTRKVLVPLLLEALKKFDLMDTFCSVVGGFVNSTNLVAKFADSFKVTSLSLRSLCKTILSDTNPSTNSAGDRCKVLVGIVEKLVGTEEKNGKSYLTASKVASVAVTVLSEVEELAKLKGMLGTQGTLRPIFEPHLRQRRAVREKAMVIRKKVAESGVDYATLKELYDQSKGAPKEETTKESSEDDKKEEEVVSSKNEERLMSACKQGILDKVREVTEEEADELVKLLQSHFENLNIHGQPHNNNSQQQQSQPQQQQHQHRYNTRHQANKENKPTYDNRRANKKPYANRKATRKTSTGGNKSGGDTDEAAAAAAPRKISVKEQQPVEESEC